MILVNEIRGKMVAKGYTYKSMAKELGMTDRTFGTKMKKGVFGSAEIEKMIVLLEIEDPNKIFFADVVTRKVTN
jgi:hypothetical protein